MHCLKTCFIPLLSLMMVMGCGRDERLFRELSPKRSGVEFTNLAQESDQLGILDYLYFYNGGGVATGDINNDGLPDIYFTSNQGPNKLFLNKGGMKFEDITERAGVAGQSSWNTGVTMADVNGDGYLDIYVCAVVGLLGFEGHNELFINRGDDTFSEQSAQYGLDFDTYSSSAAFFDYDRDGDLDLYLLNHAVHTQESYGKASLRNQRNYSSGDRLLRNDGGTFTDVSEQAGIYGGINGYGLGLCTADFNRDGFTDLYIGNDFHEDDYYYLNQGDGTFRESLREYFGHTSRFSMGSDAGDLNGDGFADLISLDMLPDREAVLKSSEGDDNIQVQRMRTEQYGYHYQFSRNMVYLNQPGGQFLEVGLMSGMAATDWSWSALMADYDQDGYNDVFISNGIARRPNDLDFVRYVSNEQVQKKLDNTSMVDREALEWMPEGAASNRIFQGSGSAVLTDRTGEWIEERASLSGAVALADLDGDGDLDLVINNFNSPAQILLNRTKGKNAYLKIRLRGPARNTFGLGAQVTAYAKGQAYFRELYTTRGFQASSEPVIHLGLGRIEKLDSVRIHWPDGTTELLGEQLVNQTLDLVYDASRVRPTRPTTEQFARSGAAGLRFEKDTTGLGIDFVHVEDSYTHFNREPLIPYSLSDRGPAVLSGDLNGDGKTDLYYGASKYAQARAFVQQDSAFVPWELPELIGRDSIKEWISGSLADFNGDGRNDLILGSGGADFFGNSPVLTDSYFVQDRSGQWTDGTFPALYGNTSVVEPFDIDGDGDLDLFLGIQAITGAFGQPADSYILENQGGRFVIAQRIPFEGMPTAAHWYRAGKGQPARLLVVGEWMSPRLFETGPSPGVTEVPLRLPSGLWECLEPIDWDRDGDLDFALGNWGTNTKFTASDSHPLMLYTADYDGNGSAESVVCTYREGAYFPIYAYDDLASRLPFLRKKFVNFRDYAGKNVEEVLGRQAVKAAKAWSVNELRSGLLINEGDGFVFQPFPELLQVSPIMAFMSFNVDQDPGDELLVAGNYFGVKPYQGRFDSFPGALLDPEAGVTSGLDLGLDWQQKSARALHRFEINGHTYILASFNDAKAELYQMNKR